VKTRNTSLDVLRALAILVVIGGHLGWFGSLSSAGFGVDLFLVLSGFFISGVLFSDYRIYGTIRLGRFWTRRAFKILPPICLYMIVLFVFLRAVAVDDLYKVFLFVSNVFDMPPILAHTWSLSLEEQFYLCLPLLLVVLARRNKSLSSVPWLFIGVMVIAFVLRIPHPIEPRQFQLRMDNLFAGVVLRYLVDFRPEWFKRLVKFSLVPGLLCWVPAVLLLFPHTGMVKTCLYTWIDFGCACLVAWCYHHDGSAFWTWAPMRCLAAVGVFSYSIYIWQQPFTFVWPTVARVHFAFTPLMATVSGLALSVAVGAVMYYAVEAPSMRIRDAWCAASPLRTLRQHPLVVGLVSPEE